MTHHFLLGATIILLIGLVVWHYRTIKNLIKQNERLGEICSHWERLATVDVLTGAKSRVLLFVFLNREMEFVRRSHDEESSLVLYLDLNDFKLINDQFGHEMGDAVLRKFVATVQHVIRRSDDIFRLGGDEFIVFARVKEREGALQLLHKIKTALQITTVETAEGYGKEFPLSASVGGTFITLSDGSPEELIRRADNALYFSKGNKEAGTYALYPVGEEPIWI